MHLLMKLRTHAIKRGAMYHVITHHQNFVSPALLVCALGMEAQMLPNPYGPPITVENAKKAAAAALAEAVKNHWVMAVAIVDPNGTLVYYEKSDNTQIGSANVSINKARSAALYKRPTKAFQDAWPAAAPAYA